MEVEVERRKLGQSQSEPELIPTSVVATATDHTSHSQITKEQTATSQSDKISDWFLQLLYNLILETSKIIYFIMKVD